jgi:hypothetical protein
MQEWFFGKRKQEEKSSYGANIAARPISHHVVIATSTTMAISK